MTSVIETVELAALCASVDYGYTASAEAEPVGPKFLRITDIVGGPIDWRTVPYCTIEPIKAAKFQLNDADIVVARTGATTGVSAFIKEPPKSIFASYLVRLKIKPEVNARFVYYFMQSERYWSYIHGVLGDKSAQPNASASTIAKVRLCLPRRKDQDGIAAVLGAMDDKLELNRRMNDTLEALARALFKSWFIDYDPVKAKAEGRRPSGMDAETALLFPSDFNDSSIGRIPREWQAKTIEQISKRVGIGPFGSSIKVETFVDNGVPIISGQHLRGFMMEDNTFNFITPQHADKLSTASVRRGDVILTHAGNIGQAAYIPENSQYERYVISQRQFFVRCDAEQVTPAFLAFYFKSPEGQHRLLANASSSGVPSIAQPVTYVRSISLAVPTNPVMHAFDDSVQPLLRKFHANLREVNTLTSVRDFLLSKLISGDVRVRDAEAVVGKVA